MKDFRKLFKWFKTAEIPYKRLKDKSEENIFPKVGQTYKKYTQPDYKEYKGKGRKMKGKERKSIKRKRKLRKY